MVACGAKGRSLCPTGSEPRLRPTPACRISRNASSNCATGIRRGAAARPARPGIAPKNPFYLSYTGLLAAVAEKRYGDGEALCQEALGMRHNHAQLYLNLAEVYQQSGRTQEAIATLEKGTGVRGTRFPHSPGSAENRLAARSDAELPAPQPSGESNAGKIASSFDRAVASSLSDAGPAKTSFLRAVIRGGSPQFAMRCSGRSECAAPDSFPNSGHRAASIH